MVAQRSRSKFSARKGDVTRLWTDEFFRRILLGIRVAFPNYVVVPFSDQNSTLMNCISCQLELFSRTTVFIGMHGAGLSNLAFMPVGGVVIEITPTTDGRMMPWSGPFSRLAMASGIHHYIFNLATEQQTFTKFGTTFDETLLVNAALTAVDKFLSIN